MAAARTVWFSFHLGCHTSAVSLSADSCPTMGIGLLLQFPHPPRVGSVLLILLFSPLVPLSYLLPSFAWFYIFFSTGQLLLSALSWCSLCTSVSEAVFWCIHGERCTPHPPTPLPSFIVPVKFLILLLIPIILSYNNNMLWCKSFFLQVIVLDAHWVVLI